MPQEDESSLTGMAGKVSGAIRRVGQFVEDHDTPVNYGPLRSKDQKAKDADRQKTITGNDARKNERAMQSFRDAAPKKSATSSKAQVPFNQSHVAARQAKTSAKYGLGN